MDLKLQRKLARKVLDIGNRRIWFDPDRSEEIKEALTRQDILTLVNRKAIKIQPKRGISRGRVKKDKKSGPGSRKGTKKARTPKKEAWMSKIRAIRKTLRVMKEKGHLDTKEYRDLYKKASGGFFRNVSHLKIHVNKLKKKGE